MKGIKILQRLYLLMARTVMATGVFKLRLGKRTLGERLEGILFRVERDLSPHLTPSWRRWLTAIVPPASLRMLTLGTWEPETTRLFKQLLRPGVTVVDVGASIGYYTVLAAREVGNQGSVFAFEPAPACVPLLQRNMALGGGSGVVTIVPLAVSNRCGKVELFLDGADSSLCRIGNTANDPVKAKGGKAFTMVETTSLDAHFANLGSPRVDLIKMDIEGAEKLALEGMKELSRRNPQLKLIIEFCPWIQREAGVSPDEFFHLLQEVGFTRFSAIFGDGAAYAQGNKPGLELLEIPADVPRLMNIIGDKTVNLLCEKD